MNKQATDQAVSLDELHSIDALYCASFPATSASSVVAL